MREKWKGGKAAAMPSILLSKTAIEEGELHWGRTAPVLFDTVKAWPVLQPFQAPGRTSLSLSLPQGAATGINHN